MNTQVDDQSFNIPSFASQQIVPVANSLGDVINFKRLVGNDAKIEMYNNSEIVFFNNGQSSLRIGNYEPLEKMNFKPNFQNSITNPAILLYNADPTEQFALMDIGIEQTDGQNRAYIAFKKDNVNNYAKIQLKDNNITLDANDSFVVNGDEIVNNGLVVSPVEYISDTTVNADDITLNHAELIGVSQIIFGESSTNRATQSGYADTIINAGINAVFAFLGQLPLGPVVGSLNYSVLRTPFNDETQYKITGLFQNALSILEANFTKFAIAVASTGSSVGFLSAALISEDRLIINESTFTEPINSSILPVFTTSGGKLQFSTQSPFTLFGKTIGTDGSSYFTYKATSLNEVPPLEFVFFPPQNNNTTLYIRDTNIKFMKVQNGILSREQPSPTSTQFKIYIDYANWFKPEILPQLRQQMYNDLPWVTWLNYA